jgi:YHS domain-containing protein
MTKINVLIFLMTILFCAVLTAQEQPLKEQEAADKTEQIMTGETVETSEGLPTEVAWNRVCPVKGNPIEDDTPTVEYDGKTYGFCCPGCDVKFAKNPEKYSKNLSDDGSKFIGRK